MSAEPDDGCLSLAVKKSIQARMMMGRSGRMTRKRQARQLGKIVTALQKAVPGPKVNPFEDKPKVKFGFD
jgi:hypothetical protein